MTECGPTCQGTGDGLHGQSQELGADGPQVAQLHLLRDTIVHVSDTHMVLGGVRSKHLGPVPLFVFWKGVKQNEKLNKIHHTIIKIISCFAVRTFHLTKTTQVKCDLRHF